MHIMKETEDTSKFKDKCVINYDMEREMRQSNSGFKFKFNQMQNTCT